MKRNMDLVRAILLDVEDRGTPSEPIDPQVEGFNELEVSYHVMLMEDAGLIRALDRSAIGIFRWSAGGLTWLGHEMAEHMRDEGLWESAKRDVLAASGGGLPFDLLCERLREQAARRLD